MRRAIDWLMSKGKTIIRQDVAITTCVCLRVFFVCFQIFIPNNFGIFCNGGRKE